MTARKKGPLRFNATVKQAIASRRILMGGVFKAAVQQVVHEAERTTSEGGRMRVDTGFLRASGKASLNGLPSGPSRAENGQQYVKDDQAAELVLNRMPLGGTFWYGWTASYARAREYYDGFLKGAASRWQTIVRDTVRELERRMR